MPTNRRIQRSVRVTVAVSLLVVGSVVVAAALVAREALWLGAAAVVAWGVGVAAARILSNELAESRRQHGRERAEQAQAYAALASRRATENAAFATAMKQTVADHAANVDRLKATLRLAEKRAQLAEQAAERNKVALARAQQEIALLRSQIAALETELREMSGDPAQTEDAEQVTAGDEAHSVDDLSTVIDLLAWEDYPEIERARRQRA